MSRKRRAKRIMSSKSELVDSIQVEDVVASVSKDIDDVIYLYRSSGKKLDPLYLVKLVAARYAIQFYNKALSDSFFANLDQNAMARMYSDSHAQLSMIKNAIKGESTV